MWVNHVGFVMRRRGPIILAAGLTVIGITLLVLMSIASSVMTGPGVQSISLMYEDIFDKVSDEIQINPGDSARTSYSMRSSDVILLWGIQITDYQPGDRLSIEVSNIFDDDYGTFAQNEFVLFEALEIDQSDTLDFEIQNLGDRSVHVMAMFSEDPENSAFSDPDSPLTTVLFPIAYAGIMLILGLIVSVAGVAITLVDWKNNQGANKSY